jgi:hypothetical protein
MSNNDKYANIYATLFSEDHQDSIEFSAYRFNLTPISGEQMKILKEFIPRFITLYENRMKDGILLSTCSRSIFDNKKIQHVFDKLVTTLRRHNKKQLLHDDKSGESISQHSTRDRGPV